MRVVRELSLYLFPESIEWFIEYQGFLAVVRLSPSRPPYPPLPSASSLSFSGFLCVAGRANWRERCGVGGGRGAKSYNHEEAWLFLNFSILSAYFPTQLKPCIRSMQASLFQMKPCIPEACWASPFQRKPCTRTHVGRACTDFFFIPKIDDCIDFNWNALCCSDASRKPPSPIL